MSISIGALSSRTEVKIPTIRYYEQIGLLGPAHRTEGGQRRYTDEDVVRLLGIRQARELGFEVEAIRDLLTLDEEKAFDVALARRHLRSIDRRLEALSALRAVLSNMEKDACSRPNQVFTALSRAAEANALDCHEVQADRP